MASEPVDLDAASTALIIQDLQNDTISEGGAFSESGSPAHAKAQDVVNHVTALAAKCRERGVPVIHIHYVVDEGARGLELNAPLFAGIRDAGAVVRGSWGARPVDGLEPQPGDHVVEKMRMNGFYGTRLESLLRGLQVKTVLISGAWTNMSIEHTARHAADAGFNVVVVSDGTSTVSDEWQAAAMNYALTNVGRSLRSAELISALDG
jgi:gluconolactonase